MKEFLPFALALLLAACSENEVTVYKVFCAKGYIEGECQSKEETSIPTIYKVFADQQMVIFWSENGTPNRFPHCVVRDSYNWRCKFEGDDEVTIREYQMIGGKYQEVGPKLSDSFYIVSRWYWWLVWVRQNLP
jgi:hypothetical protein